jgi:hypothetical protein
VWPVRPCWQTIANAVKPFPDEFVEGEKTEGVEALSVAKVDHLDLAGAI